MADLSSAEADRLEVVPQQRVVGRTEPGAGLAARKGWDLPGLHMG